MNRRQFIPVLSIIPFSLKQLITNKITNNQGMIGCQLIVSNKKNALFFKKFIERNLICNDVRILGHMSDCEAFRLLSNHGVKATENYFIQFAMFVEYINSNIKSLNKQRVLQDCNDNKSQLNFCCSPALRKAYCSQWTTN